MQLGDGSDNWETISLDHSTNDYRSYKGLEKKQSNFFVSEDGVLGYIRGRICVSNDEEIKK